MSLRAENSLSILLVLGLMVPAASGQFTNPDYTVVSTNGVKYGEGELSSGSNINLTMDIYQPSGSNNTYRPCLLCVHGGGWTTGSKSDSNMVAFANYFAARGFVAASINYRKIGDGPKAAPQSWIDRVAPYGITGDQANASYAAMVDTQSAIRFLRANAKTYGLDPDRIFGMGGSAGSFNVLHAGLDDPAYFMSTLPINNLGKSSSLQLVLDFWGSMLRPEQIAGTDPQVLIVHGTEDATVPYSAATSLDASLTAVGVFHQFVTLQGWGHAAWSATINGKNLRQIAHEFVIASGNISFNPSFVYVDFGAPSGAGSAISPFNLLFAGVSAANPVATVQMASGSSSESFVGGASINKPLTLKNGTPGNGPVKIGVNATRSSGISVRTGFVSSGVKH